MYNVCILRWTRIAKSDSLAIIPDGQISLTIAKFGGSFVYYRFLVVAVTVVYIYIIIMTKCPDFASCAFLCRYKVLHRVGALGQGCLRIEIFFGTFLHVLTRGTMSESLI